MRLMALLQTASSSGSRNLLPHAMTLPQFKLLTHFSRTNNVEASIVDLARIFQVTKASMGETVNKLRKKSFVTVKANPLDQREKRVSMTPGGDAARMDAIRAFSPLMQKMISEIGIQQF
jgi:DNA-binding MarR family transcriptional regulator